MISGMPCLKEDLSSLLGSQSVMVKYVDFYQADLSTYDQLSALRGLQGRRKMTCKRVLPVPRKCCLLWPAMPPYIAVQLLANRYSISSCPKVARALSAV